MRYLQKYYRYLAFMALVFPIPLFAAMTSSSYGIPSDSINFGGGNSSSTSYSQESTFGEVATGDSSSASYQLKAGYQQMQTAYIALTTSGDLTLPALSFTGGISTSSAAVHVVTDNLAGYSLLVQASTVPALTAVGGASFADYSPSGSDPDYQFSITTAQSAFGFSPEGPDITASYKDNGSTCATGSGDTQYRCWKGFSTTNQLVAQATSNNQPTGATTTLQFQAQVGSAKIQDATTYTATITVTAVTL
jgi:hypothetical protein